MKALAEVVVSQFTDDVAIYTSQPTVASMKSTFEETARIIDTNLSEIGRSLSPMKTQLVHFHQSKKPPTRTRIKINDHLIRCSPEAKFLGVIFDQRLSFKPQLAKTLRSSLKSLNIIKFLRGTWWGAHPDTLLIIFKSFVRSIIDYSSFISSPISKLDTNKLERLQYAAIRYCLGYRVSTPTNVLLAESKLPLIEKRSIFLCKNFLIKVLSNRNSQVSSTIHAMIENDEFIPNDKKRMIKKCIRELIQMIKELCMEDHFNMYLYEYRTIVASPAIEDEPTETSPEIDRRQRNAIKIFTDGSKEPNGNSVGSACFSPRLKLARSLSINPRASVFTAECLAIDEAIKIAVNSPNHDYIIVTDSLSAPTSLSRPTHNIRDNKMLLEIKKTEEFNQNNNNQNSIKFEWVPSHTGIEGNEEADRLAREATDLLPNFRLPVPFTDFREYMKKESLESTLEICIEEGRNDNARGNGKTFFKEFYRDSRKPWFHNKEYRRSTIAWVNRAKANHYHRAASLKRKNFINSAECECGCPDEDIDHVLWDCPRHDAPRCRMYCSFVKNQLWRPYSSKKILKELDPKCIEIISTFLHESNLRV
ncbi:uncharacterized protein LOC135171555 [Diachasmimorpha longicaudata]|uniref:uncharacterized protein LOC135171555 n=1 Tax=Diachasmimorpha longicaudata TaxID=58733 RepID=UPI0030B8B98A